MPEQGQPGEGWGLPGAGWVMPRWVMPGGMSGWDEWVPSFPAAPEHSGCAVPVQAGAAQQQCPAVVFPCPTCFS